MKFEMLETADNSLRFVIEGQTPAAVNSLRRTLLADVPKMAIETVEFHLGNIVDERGKEYESATPLGDSKLAPRDDLVPIVKLSDKQGILAYAIAELGVGREHAKWSPCHGVGYKYYPALEINQ